MALLIFAGIFVRRKRIVDERFESSLSSLISNLLLPCMVYTVINGGSFTKEAFQTGAAAMLLALLVTAILWMTGSLYARLFFPAKSPFAGCAVAAMVFSNFTFMGFPIVEALYGKDVLFTFMMFTFPMRATIYILPAFVMQPASSLRGKRLRQRLRPLLSPSVLSVPISLLIFALPFSVPAPIEAAIEMIGSACSPMAMLLCGISLAAIRREDLVSDRQVLWSVIGRNVIAPAVVLGVLSIWPLELPLYRTAVVYAALPTASLLTMFAVEYKADAPKMAANIFLSTLLSIATLPLWVYLVEAIIALRS